MRKTLTFLAAAALLLAFTVPTAELSAGNLNKVGVNQTGGAAYKDAGTGGAVTQTFERGIKWLSGTAGALATVATNASQAVTLTGGSSNYAGPYFVAFTNVGTADLSIYPAASVTSITTYIDVVRVKEGTSQILGPISPSSTHVHARGTTATATSARYIIGVLE